MGAITQVVFYGFFIYINGLFIKALSVRHMFKLIEPIDLTTQPGIIYLQVARYWRLDSTTLAIQDL